MSKSITLNESDCKCYTCQRCAQDCSHNNNFFRDVLSTFKMDDPDNYINTIDLNIDDVEVMDSYVPDEMDTKSAPEKTLKLDRQQVVTGKSINVYCNPDITEHLMSTITVNRVINAKFRHNCGYWLALVEATGIEKTQYVVLTDQVLYPEDVQEPDAIETELKTLKQNNEPVATPEPVQEPTLLIGEFRIIRTESVGTPVYDDSDSFVIGYKDLIKRTWLVTPADYCNGFYEEFENGKMHRPCKTLYETEFFRELIEDK